MTEDTATATPPVSPLLTATAAAKIVGVSQERIWELSRQGKIPTVKIGRTRRYRAESVMEWIVDQETPAT
jgi:excisionase family DNA binding protein